MVYLFLFPLPSSKFKLYYFTTLSSCSSFLTGLLPFSFYHTTYPTHRSTVNSLKEVSLLWTKTFAHKVKAKSSFCLAPAHPGITAHLPHPSAWWLHISYTAALFVPSLSHKSCDLRCLVTSPVFFYQNVTHSVICIKERNLRSLPLFLRSWWVLFALHLFSSSF